MEFLTQRIYRWAQLSPAQRLQALRRPVAAVREQVSASAQNILAAVRLRGDAAVREYAAAVDGFSGGPLRLSDDEWSAGAAALGRAQRDALQRAAAQLRRFHAAEMPQPLRLEVSPGLVCQRVWRPLQKVGMYVPAGSAPLPSTLLMLAVPAALAGCRERIVCTPVGASGKIHPGILVAAQIAAVTAIYKVGGAQGIAAMAYGTESIPRVDKLFGPGNAYVTQAKVLAAQDPDGAACDLPAGPSEVMVLADAATNPRFAAADLLSQAEHGADSHVVLVALDTTVLQRILEELKQQLAILPRRDIAAAALRHAAFIIADDGAQAIAIANAYAAEHLIVQLANPAQYVPHIDHAGSIFLGPWSPEAVGDYASGTNHVLPTYGQARSHGGLCMESFMKSMTIQELTPAAVQDIGPVVITLAEMEGLTAHANAVSLRLEAARAL